MPPKSGGEPADGEQRALRQQGSIVLALLVGAEELPRQVLDGGSGIQVEVRGGISDQLAPIQEIRGGFKDVGATGRERCGGEKMPGGWRATRIPEINPDRIARALWEESSEILLLVNALYAVEDATDENAPIVLAHQCADRPGRGHPAETEAGIEAGIDLSLARKAHKPAPPIAAHFKKISSCDDLAVRLKQYRIDDGLH